jgi:hypothetical protein
MNAVKANMDSGTESFMVPVWVDLTQFEDIPGYRKSKIKELLARIAGYYAIGHYTLLENVNAMPPQNGQVPSAD